MIYVVDYENVQFNGIVGASSLNPKSDALVVCVTNKGQSTANLKRFITKLKTEYKIKADIRSFDVRGKNALDYAIFFTVSDLITDPAYEKFGHITVVSKDKIYGKLGKTIVGKKVFCSPSVIRKKEEEKRKEVRFHDTICLLSKKDITDADVDWDAVYNILNTKSDDAKSAFINVTKTLGIDSSQRSKIRKKFGLEDVVVSEFSKSSTVNKKSKQSKNKTKQNTKQAQQPSY